MMDFATFDLFFHNAALFFAGAVMFVLVVMLPARVLQKRHGYSPWLLTVGLVPYVGSLFLLWALAISTPRQVSEA